MSDKEKVLQWMLERSYATGHGTSVADLLQELEWQVAEREREACAKVCDDLAANDKLSNYYAVAARAIRARGIDGATVGEVGVWGEKPPVKTYCGGKPNYVDAVNMSQECVDETAKGEHKREWVGLTRRELDIATLNLEDLGDCYLAIEAKLKEKNT